jgi:dihydrofolate reductase
MDRWHSVTRKDASMTRVFIDSAMSIDGFWADREGQSVFPLGDMHSSGLIEALVDRTGAVVMSRRSFEMAEDPDWFAGNYELQVPIHVITDAPPTKHPKEDGVTFSFHKNFAGAIAGARRSACGRDVAIIGERSAVEAAIAADEVDEIYLRIVPKLCGAGEPLIKDLRDVHREFDLFDVKTTGNAVHIHLMRN